MSDAPMDSPLPDAAAKADAATGSLGLRSTLPSAPEPAAAAPAVKPGSVVLATVAPLGSLTLSPLGNEAAVVITNAGTEVDAETAERAHAEAMLAGFRLREV